MRTSTDAGEPAPAARHRARRQSLATPALARHLPASIGVVGRGRAGTALGAALRAAGLEVHGPTRRGEVPSGEALLLCVPDSEIHTAAAQIAAPAVRAGARLVGHVSGATPLSALAPAEGEGAELFGIHPLQTLSTGAPMSLAGAGCAIAGSTRHALAAAEALARHLGMRPFEIDDARRASYHASASIASNFLVTLEAAAEAAAGGAGFAADEARASLAPLVRQTVDNWALHGPAGALTGPVARGDEPTVVAQRDAVAAVDPALLPLFDVLVERTRALAERPPAAGRSDHESSEAAGQRTAAAPPSTHERSEAGTQQTPAAAERFDDAA